MQGERKKPHRNFIAMRLMKMHGRRGSNSRHPVLETGALPTELLPCFAGAKVVESFYITSFLDDIFQ